MEDKTDKSQFITDIAHPGTTKPSDNSKNVIVNNRATLKDPMVAGSTRPEIIPEKEASDTDSTKQVKAESPTIKPLNLPDENTGDAPEAEPVAQDTSNENDIISNKADEPEVAGESVYDLVPESSKTGDEQSADAAQKILEAEAEKKAAHDAEIQKLVDSKDYYLDINVSHAQKKQTKKFIIIGAVLGVVLLLAWLDIALDASIIHIGGLKSLTHFFSS